MKRSLVLSAYALLVPLLLLISLVGCVQQTSPASTPAPPQTPATPPATSPISPPALAPPPTSTSEPTPAPPVSSENGDGWTTYSGEETGICFRYPSEWGEVIDYIDYFKGMYLPYWQQDEVSEEEKAIADEWEAKARDAGQYLCFSNLDREWGAHIRITSPEKMQSFIAYASQSYISAEQPEPVRTIWAWPLLGYLGSQLVQNPDYSYYYDVYPEPLEQMIRDIADLPEGASSQELQDKAIPVFWLFANGVRYADIKPEDDPSIAVGVLSTTHGQITTTDGELKGITEIGSEGFDTGGRDYWDCLLNTSDGTQMVYITFSLYLPHYGAWDNPVEWSAGEMPPGLEEALDEQQSIFMECVRTITLLK